MKRILTLALATTLFAGCIRDNTHWCSDDEIVNRLETIEQSILVLENQIADGFLIKSVTPLSTPPGGWRIEFTGGNLSYVDIMNGNDSVNDLTPMVQVRTNPDGSTTLWVNKDGKGYVNTGVNLSGPTGATIPRMDVRRNADGTLTVWYNATKDYPASGWVDTGVDLRAGSGPILSIIDNGSNGTVSMLLNDDAGTRFEFDKFSMAERFEVLAASKVVLEEGGTGSVRFRVNPSTVWIPTGSGKQILSWTLDNVDQSTRAGYTTPSENFELVSILPSTLGEGEYVATVKCVKMDMSAIDADHWHTLVLNAGTSSAPVLVSSALFNLGHEAAQSANSFVVRPGGEVEITMGQLLLETANAEGVVSAPRVQEGDDVTVDWTWADTPGTLTPKGAVAAIEMTTPRNSGLNTRFRVTAGTGTGNVVVSARVAGRIVWSWHIWVADFDPEATGITYKSPGTPSATTPDAGRTLVVMDRNVGATGATPADGYSTAGLSFQWGRKDPLPNYPRNVSGDYPVVYTPDSPHVTVQLPALFGTRTFDEVMRLPGHYALGQYYQVNDYYATFWCVPSSPTFIGSLWHDNATSSNGFKTVKGVYDPCPLGWRMPSAGAFDGIAASTSGQSPVTDPTLPGFVGYANTPLGFLSAMTYIYPIGPWYSSGSAYYFHYTQDASAGDAYYAFGSTPPRPPVGVNTPEMAAGRGLRCVKDA